MAEIRNDICYAVSNRQNAVKELTQLVELVIVIGSLNSSNCVRLKEVAESHGVEALLAYYPSEISEYNIEKFSSIGITSGASTPEILVDNFMNKAGDYIQEGETTYINSRIKGMMARMIQEAKKSGIKNADIVKELDNINVEEYAPY